MKSSQEQLIELRRGAAEILLEADLAKELARGKPLQVKTGFGPHRAGPAPWTTVAINQDAAFQDLGHESFFSFGDFTA